ncbi:MAG: CaiB/BaiF CoA transferase family protein [Janthinobacterium lividum]
MSQTEEGAAAPHEALKGIRVVDFTIVMAGPMCTRMLADVGADVIKIESSVGDLVRQRQPKKGEVSAYFASLNCGKRSIVLDLQSDEGREIAQQLIESADVVVESFRPGVMQRLGLDYAAMSAKNPRLIYCSVSGFGQTGPRAKSPGIAPVIHAKSGYDLAFMGYQNNSERPANNGIFIADVLAAGHATAAINLALFDRERTGRGQSIDVALIESVLSMLVYEVQEAQAPDLKPRQVYQPVRANDGFVMVAAISPKNMETLFNVIGLPELKNDPRFATVSAKEDNWHALLAIIEGWTSQRSAIECEQTFMAAGVPSARYATVAEAMADPQIRGRGTLERIGNDDFNFEVVNPPFKMSGTVAKARQRIPGLGEHTDEVLKEVLGLDPTSPKVLRAKGQSK